MRRGNGKQFLGNINTMEVYDLDNEQTLCQIDEIITAGHDRYFTPDTLSQAKSQGFDNGHWCIGGSER